MKIDTKTKSHRISRVIVQVGVQDMLWTKFIFSHRASGHIAETS